MMSACITNINVEPEFNYHLLRGALEKFHKNIVELNEQQYQQVLIMANKTFFLESKVLSTQLAYSIKIPNIKLQQAIKQVRARYSDREAFLMDLADNGLNENTLSRSLHREILFNAVLEHVAVKVPSVSDVDINIFYQLHLARFIKPERRKARHILITINPQFPENNRLTAHNRILSILNQLHIRPAFFNKLATKYSECPTAIEGGILGEIVQGRLFPELDRLLFSMKEGGLSGIVETEMGFHVLFCEKIIKSHTLRFSQVKEHIARILQQRQKKSVQKTWINNLLKGGGEVINSTI